MHDDILPQPMGAVNENLKHSIILRLYFIAVYEKKILNNFHKKICKKHNITVYCRVYFNVL